MLAKNKTLFKTTLMKSMNYLLTTIFIFTSRYI